MVTNNNVLPNRMSLQRNKSSDFIGVKLFAMGAFSNELSRPFYTSLGPHSAVYAIFDPTVESIMLIVLGEFAFESRFLAAAPSSLDSVIQHFSMATVYEIPSKGKNVLLKYKPGTGMQLRVGSTFSERLATRIFRSSTDGKLDPRTNVESIKMIYST